MTCFADYKYANLYMYTDVRPFEITMFVSTKTIEIREMEAKELPWKKEVHKGGFLAHVSNQRDQKWDITSNKSNPTFRIRKNKVGSKFCTKTWKWVDNYIWKDKDGNRYILSTEPRKFHDYNF